jgi:hypothetical protein
MEQVLAKLLSRLAVIGQKHMELVDSEVQVTSA